MTSRPPLIGILGGMGPEAGLDLADKLIALTSAKCDQDHIPFILFSLPASVPDRTSFLLGQTDINPAYGIADQFRKMSKMGVTIAAMACNTAHADPIFDVTVGLLRDKGVEIRILHMVRETIAYIRGCFPGIKRVGILGTQGTYQSRLYDRALEDVGLEAVIPDPKVREDYIHDALYDPLFGIKTCPGAVSEEATRRIRSAIGHLHELGAEAIILGCTELPLAVKESRVDGIPILDPARITAEKLIRETYPDRLAMLD
jgi:aspartate racemase